MNGQPQREYIPREQCTSPTIANTLLMLTLSIAAKEKQHVATVNVTRAYLNAEMDDFFMVKFIGRALDIMCKVNPEYTKLIVAVDELAGRVWEEDFKAIQHHQITPHYRHSTAIQTILPDGSVSDNLARTIPEAITTIRGKPKLQDTLRMTTEQMVLIDEEITASNARKFGKSSIARAHFSKKYTQQWYTEARARRFNDSI